MKIGLDVHGVITDNLEFFKKFIPSIIAAGGEIHIISGPPQKQIWEEVNAMGIRTFDCHIFSIVDYHKNIGTPMKQDEKGQWHTVKEENGVWVQDQYVWDKTKADYCLKHGIDLMIDDSDAYGYFFRTPYARFFSKNKRKHFIVQGDIK